MTAEPGVPSSRAELDAMWRRQEPFWHAVFVVVWGAAVVVTAIEPAGRFGRWPDFILLTVIGVAYLVYGRRGIRQEQRAGTIYQLIAWTALLAIQWADPGTQSWMLFFVLYPQLWAMLRTRIAVPATFVTIAAFAVLRWAQSPHTAIALNAIVGSAVISLGVSLALGLFIRRITHEAESRASTIDELRDTQARLAAAERDRGVHEERERISREIHDTLAQGFTSVVTLARAADAALARGDGGAARERLALIERTAADNLAEARLIVAELTPGHLQSRTLVQALERLGAAVSQENGLHARVRIVGEPAPLGGASEVVILRTAQEALSNVRRHAKASVAEVTLEFRADEAVLTVTDDGQGFDPAVDRDGFGLDGVRARAAQVAGTVSLTSSAAAGTTLRLEVPR